MPENLVNASLASHHFNERGRKEHVHTHTPPTLTGAQSFTSVKRNHKERSFTQRASEKPLSLTSGVAASGTVQRLCKRSGDFEG